MELSDYLTRNLKTVFIVNGDSLQKINIDPYRRNKAIPIINNLTYYLEESISLMYLYFLYDDGTYKIIFITGINFNDPEGDLNDVELIDLKVFLKELIDG